MISFPMVLCRQQVPLQESEPSTLRSPRVRRYHHWETDKTTCDKFNYIILICSFKYTHFHINMGSKQQCRLNVCDNTGCFITVLQYDTRGLDVSVYLGLYLCGFISEDIGWLNNEIDNDIFTKEKRFSFLRCSLIVIFSTEGIVLNSIPSVLKILTFFLLQSTTIKLSNAFIIRQSETKKILFLLICILKPKLVVQNEYIYLKIMIKYFSPQKKYFWWSQQPLFVGHIGFFGNFKKLFLKNQCTD